MPAAGDLLRRSVGVRRVVFGHLADDDAGRESRDDRERQPQPVLNVEQIEDDEGRGSDQHRTDVDAYAQRTQQLTHRGTLFRPHEEDSDDRQEDTDSGDQHRRQHGARLHLHVARSGESSRAERRRGEHRAAIALVEVGAHAGHVAHVVAHVVGNGGGIARVVLRNARFDLTDQIGPHIGRLGVDAAAHAGEERLRRGTHAEGQHRGGDDDQFLRAGGVDEAVQDDIPERNIEQPQPHDDQPHHGSAAECDTQPAVERLLRRMCRPRRGIGGGLHAEETRQSRKEPAREESEGNPRVLHAGDVGQIGEKKRQHDEDDRDDLVLLAQIGHCARTDMAGDLAHSLRAFALTFHLPIKRIGETERDDRRRGHEPENRRNVHFSVVFC